ncbi:hypothetical protein PS639_05957 [Pseudomonas fluorescens]|nr:hypothetical protein PS639_04301 [Pseudomonas fluorescens]VVN47965.1 hypothetical protein PS639_05957 [Pseudomonas fluorescens]
MPRRGHQSICLRPWYYLKKAVDGLAETDVVGAIDTIPYGYREFWAQRYNLVLHLCMESKEIWEDGNNCASEEVRNIIQMLRTTSIDDAVRLAGLYIEEKFEQRLFPIANITTANSL